MVGVSGLSVDVSRWGLRCVGDSALWGGGGGGGSGAGSVRWATFGPVGLRLDFLWIHLFLVLEWNACMYDFDRVWRTRHVTPESRSFWDFSEFTVFWEFAKRGF
jgi:hypothetical protein